MKEHLLPVRFHSRIYHVSQKTRVIKLEVGCSTEQALVRIKKRMNSDSLETALRQSLVLTDYLIRSSQNHCKILIEQENGTYSEMILK